MPSSKIQEVRKNLAEYVSTNPISTKKVESHPYFFLSLDLVNSTEVKSADEKWPRLIDAFYGCADREVKKITDIQSWKFVGDEVLFFKRIRDMADLEQCVEKAYAAVQTVTAQMRNIQRDDASTKISVKGTAWIAKAVRLPPAENRDDISPEYRNLVVTIQAESGQTLKDFLGPDIDIGFRVSKFAHSNLLTISAELARVILKKGTQQTAEKLRIVGYERLKGVWGGRYYPIVWLCNNWQETNNIFEYDDSFDSAHVAKAQTDGAVPLTSSALDRAFDTVGHSKFTDEFISILTMSETQAIDTEVELDAVNDASLEVHCVAVCFRENGHVLIGKRSGNKRILPMKWEFGCAQLSLNKSFFEAMQVHYKADFGVELDFQQKDPVAQYFVPSKGVSGVVFVANVLNPEDAETKFLKEKHSEVRWIDPKNHHISPDDCIPEFAATLEKAYAYWIAPADYSATPVTNSADSY